MAYCVEVVNFEREKQFYEGVEADSPLDAMIYILRNREEEWDGSSPTHQIAVWDTVELRLEGQPPIAAKTARHEFDCLICGYGGRGHRVQCALV